MSFDGSSAHDSFANLLDITLPKGGWVMALYQAFFDESGNGDDSPFLCVGGYLFTKEAAAEIDEKWRKLVADYDVGHFHMADCNSAGGNFAHLSEEDCDKAAREAIGLIKTHAAHGIVLSLEKSAAHLLPKTGIWDGNSYAFLANQVGYAVRDWTEPQDRVSYIFEAGAHGQGGALVAMNMFLGHADIKADFRHIAHSFMAKPDAPLLQCADMLVWHWHKRNVRLTKGHKRLRGDFKSLLEVPTVAHHYDAESLGRFREFLGLPAA